MPTAPALAGGRVVHVKDNCPVAGRAFANMTSHWFACLFLNAATLQAFEQNFDVLRRPVPAPTTNGVSQRSQRKSLASPHMANANCSHIAWIKPGGAKTILTLPSGATRSSVRNVAGQWREFQYFAA